MSTWVLRTPEERDDALTVLRDQPLPFTLSSRKGANRSIEQNRLQRLWMKEASEQRPDHTAEEYRAYCKLHFGVPILRNENDDFREAYDRVIRPHSYEDKLAMMAVPLDFPVTRLMTSKEKKTYLDDIYEFLTGLGVRLTEPKERR